MLGKEDVGTVYGGNTEMMGTEKKGTIQEEGTNMMGAEKMNAVYEEDIDMFEERIKALNKQHENLIDGSYDDGKRTYTVSEIQDILGISRPTAYNIIASGVFKSVRAGNRIRVSRKSFDEWLDKQTG